MECDQSQPASIQRFVKEVLKMNYKFDALICNAGVMPPSTLEVGPAGVEATFFINHCAHVMIVNGLLSALTKSGRVVMLSSSAHSYADPKLGLDLDNLDCSKFYHPWKQYGVTKLANLLFAQYLATKFEDTEHVALAAAP
jgi:NAD(P)-dependent dehydrogenase (short-subunit alcohol dehydrogenase family)